MWGASSFHCDASGKTLRQFLSCLLQQREQQGSAGKRESATWHRIALEQAGAAAAEIVPPRLQHGADALLCSRTP